jgi:hypothetical protein
MRFDACGSKAIAPFGMKYIGALNRKRFPDLADNIEHISRCDICW